jgi:hypothetical protein
MPLKPLEVLSITQERLGEWGKGLKEANCTPILLIGVSHGEGGGEPHIFIPEELSARQVSDLLSMVGLDIKRKALWQKLVATGGEEFREDNLPGEG